MAKPINYYNALDAPDDFVGARVFETHIDFYFPYGFEVDVTDATQCKKDALRLLSVVSIASRSDLNRELSFDAKGNMGRMPVNSYIWVINDYAENGLYSATMKTFRRDQFGRINWKRTFKTQSSLTNDSFIYLEPVIEVKTRTDNLLTAIHHYCLQVAAEKVGWLFGMSNATKFRDVTENQKLYFERSLLRELRVSFDDRKKILLNHLLRIVRSALGEQVVAGKFELGTYEFHYAWEYMIQAVYGNLPLGDFFPQAQWCIGDGMPRKSSSLRPDTVMTIRRGGGDALFIIDAKYYKYGMTRNFHDLPNSNSIQKQITYGDHAKLRHGDRFCEIMNLFLIPFANDGEEKMKYVGYAESDWRENQDAYQKVHCVLMDTRYLIDLYFGRKNDDETRGELASILNERSKKCNMK